MHLGLTWDWVPDLTRELNNINSEELDTLADQLSPFLTTTCTTLSRFSRTKTPKKLVNGLKRFSARDISNLEHLKAEESRRTRQEIQEPIEPSLVEIT